MKLCPKHPKHQEWLASQRSNDDSDTEDDPSDPELEPALPIMASQRRPRIVTAGSDTAPSSAVNPPPVPDAPSPSILALGELNRQVPEAPEQDAPVTQNATSLPNDEDDPDLELSQYEERINILPSGFRAHIEGRNVKTLPQEK